MPTQANLTKLDATAVNAFVNGPLAEFLAALDLIGQDSGGTLSPRSIAHGYTNPDTFPLTKPLAIGLMAGGDTVHGSTLNTSTLKFTQSVDQNLRNLQNLSQELRDTLIAMVEKFLTKQGQSLTQISAQEFLNTIRSASGPATTDPTKIPDATSTTGT
ncbi:type VII secretion system-associated protein [Streptomyces sp. NPDC058955]|uniref:type VII secretion system-associated protein n=1 Tax=unclassified Streptomyces TaxID=2593676 RepID=UPI00364CC0E5